MTTARFTSLLCDAAAARFVVDVSGHIGGVDVAHSIYVSGVPHEIGDIAATVFLAVTGKRLALRRADWSLSGGLSGAYVLRLLDANGEIAGQGRVTFNMRKAIAAPAPEAAPEAKPAATYGIACDQGGSVQLLGESTSYFGPRRVWAAATEAEAIAKMAEYTDVPASRCTYRVVRVPSLGADVDAAPVTPAPAAKAAPAPAPYSSGRMGALAAGVVLALMSAPASADSERASFMGIVAKACGVSVTVARPNLAYLAQFAAKHAATLAQRAVDDPASHATVCKAALRSIRKDGAALGVTFNVVPVNIHADDKARLSRLVDTARAHAPICIPFADMLHLAGAKDATLRKHAPAVLGKARDRLDVTDTVASILDHEPTVWTVATPKRAVHFISDGAIACTSLALTGKGAL